MGTVQKQVFLRRARRKRTIAVVFAGLVVAAVAFVSFLPGRDKHHLHTNGRYHSWGHLIAFAIVAFVAGRTARSQWASLFLFLGSLAFGFGIEFGEHFVFRSGLEWKDMLVDAIGVSCGTLMAIVSSPKTPE